MLGNQAPSSHRELWAGVDPRREPLETEFLREWEEGGVGLRIVRLRIGIFRGQKAIMATIYGFPQGAARVPGLVQIHGGGQYADYRAVLSNAKRGDATLSIAWAGRMNAPEYHVTPKEVTLFWERTTSDPSYRLTEDWGLLDAYHAPSRNPKNAFASISPAAWTLDGVASPRNHPWFLCNVGARRALTFLEEQVEVDAARLGGYGYSMGGKNAVLTAGADPRVKAAAPSCGGVSDRDNGEILYQRTIGDDVSPSRITCPIVFLSPASDFHGRIDDLQEALNEILSPDWRLTCLPHHNHQDTASYEVATQLWFDENLRGGFEFSETPKTLLTSVLDNGVPMFRVQPDRVESVLAVDIYYTQQGQVDGDPDDRENTIARFWRHASANNTEDGWIASLPLFRTDKPLWVYANVVYPLTRPIRGAGYYYRAYKADQFNVS